MQTVNAQPGKRYGLALLLAAGLIAALIAAVFSFSPGVGAHSCSTIDSATDVHQDIDGVACTDTTNHSSTGPNHAALSSTKPGDTDVAIRLKATAEADIAVGKIITVDFSPSSTSGFAVPSTFESGDISIGDTDVATVSFVSNDGDKVKLTVPANENVSKDATYTITFKTAAGIGNPSAGGPRDITVSSDVTDDLPDTITAMLDRTWVTPLKGPRGQTFRIKGEEYPTGTVTIFDGSDKIVHTGETLDTQLVPGSGVNIGTFTSAPLRVRGSLGDSSYTVQTKDSLGDVRSVTYNITEATMSFSPEPAQAGEEVTITITDWQEGTEGVAAVYIAGVEFYANLTEYQNCYTITAPKDAVSNVVTFEVTVPVGTLPGMQMVQVYKEGQFTEDVPGKSKCALNQQKGDLVANSTAKITLKTGETPVIEKTLEIVSKPPPPGIPGVKTTTISPAEGSRSQTFTVSGTNYPQGTVTIFDGPDETASTGEILDFQEVPGSGTKIGEFDSTPLRVRGDTGSLSYQVWAQDSSGDVSSVTYYITKPTTTFEPHVSRPGDTVTITIADWRHGDKGMAAVYIAGQQAYGVTEHKKSNADEYCYDKRDLKGANTKNVVFFPIKVPSVTLPGMQMVEVYTEDQLAHDSCDDNELSTWAKQPNRVATLKGGVTPVIQKTIEIVSELPTPGDPPQNAVTVDGGRDREVKLKAYPPRDTDIHLDAGDKIEISLPEFDLSGASFQSSGDKGVITIDGSVILPGQITADDSGDKLTITLPSVVSLSARAGEFLDIIIAEDSGILTPETPRGYVKSNEGYPVDITFVENGTRTEAAKNNFVVVRNPISSDVPSAQVQVRLVTYAEADIGASQEITVDFSGPSADSEFFVPATIPANRVSISYVDAGQNISFRPEVLVQGAKVILTIPTGATVDTQNRVPEGEFTITFSSTARIRNPFAAGNYEIKVSSSVQEDELDSITAVVRRTTTIDPLEGPRGSQFTLKGGGYAPGTVTIYHDANNNETIDAGETLDSVITSHGAFSVVLVVGGQRGDLEYPVTIRDSEGVDTEVKFAIKSGMFFNPVTARVGRPLRITISDWEDTFAEENRRRQHRRRAGLRLGAEGVHQLLRVSGGLQSGRGRGLLRGYGSRHVPGGLQTVAVYSHTQLDPLLLRAR